MTILLGWDGDACPIIPEHKYWNGVFQTLNFLNQKFNKVRDIIKEKIESELL